MDATTRAIAIVLRQWAENEPPPRPPATVTHLAEYRKRKAQRPAQHTPRGGNAA